MKKINNAHNNCIVFHSFCTTLPSCRASWAAFRESFRPGVRHAEGVCRAREMALLAANTCQIFLQNVFPVAPKTMRWKRQNHVRLAPNHRFGGSKRPFSMMRNGVPYMQIRLFCSVKQSNLLSKTVYFTFQKHRSRPSQTMLFDARNALFECQERWFRGVKTPLFTVQRAKNRMGKA